MDQPTKSDEPTPQPAAEAADLPPVMAAPPSSEPTSRSRRFKKKWLLPLSIVLAVLAIVGISSAAYFGLIISKQPKYVLARAIGNTISSEKMSSSQYDGELTVTNQKDKKTYAGTFTGGADSKNLTLSASIGIEGTTLKLDVRTIDNSAAYLKVDGLKGLSDVLTASDDKTLAQSAPFIESLNGQWVAFDQNALKSLGAGTPTDTFSLSEKDAKKVEQMYKKHFFFEVTKTYPDQKVHGAESHHYRVKVNQDELQAFVTELKAADVPNVTIPEEAITQLKKSQVGKYPFELWIDRDKQIINQVSATFVDDSAKVSIRMALHDINKPIEVTKPQGAKTLLEVLGVSLGDQMNMLDDTDNTETSVELQPLYN